MRKLLSICICTLLTALLTAQVSQTVNVVTAGTLSTLTNSYYNSVTTNLTVTGNIDARDIKFIRDKMDLLTILDLSGVIIKTYVGDAGTYGEGYYSGVYPENTMPRNSFYNDKTLSGKTSLKTIVLPFGIISIENSAFYNCSGITAVNLPSSLTTIESSAFYNCTGLTNLSLPSGITSINSYTFSNCTGLVTLTFPANLTIVGNEAFKNCSGLKTIYSLNSLPPALLQDCFKGANAVIDVFVTTDANVTIYKGNTIWYNYFPGNIIKKAISTSISQENRSNVKVYSKNSEILIDGTLEGEAVQLYTANGIQLQSIVSRGEKLNLQVDRDAVYFVKIGEKTFKVIL